MRDTNQIISKRFGARLEEGRKLNGWSQGEAAKILGYSNSSYISKLEGGTSTPTLQFICYCAQKYAVSADYLLGLCDYPERDPASIQQLAVVRALEGLITEKVVQMTAQSQLTVGVVAPAMSYLKSALDAATECLEVLTAIRESTAFDDEIRGGAKLVRAIEKLKSLSTDGLNWLKRETHIREQSIKSLLDN